MPARSLILLIFCLCVFNPNPLHSQSASFHFSRLDITQGLSHNQVTGVYRDQQGFVWFGTMSGLNRYDGYHFRIFHHDLTDSNSLSDDNINQVLEGPGQTMWVGTRAGFCIYDPIKEKFDRHAREWLHAAHIDADSILDIRKDTKGDFWFLASGRGGGLYRYNAMQRIAHCIESSQPSAFAWDGSKGWWIVYHDGTLRNIDAFTGRSTTESAIVHHLFPKDSLDYHIYVDAGHDCWLYTSGVPNGVILVRPSGNFLHRIVRTGRSNGLNTDLVTGILQDNKGFIWVATDHGGVNVIDKKDLSIQWLVSREDDDKCISQNCINSLYKDSSGIVWVGTFKKGVNFYHGDMLRFPLYRHRIADSNSLPYDDVNRFVEDEKGNLWIGTNGGGLLYFDRGNGRFTRYRHDASKPGSLTNDVIVSLCMDRKHRLWIGTYYGGLDCYDGKTFTHYRHHEEDTTSLADDRVWEIREDPHGRLFVGTLAAGLDRLDPETKRFTHYRPGSGIHNVHSGYIADLMEDREHNLWIATAAGIDVLDAETNMLRHYGSDPKDPSSLSNNNVLTVFEDSRGLIWAGTREGLDLFDPRTNSFVTYRTRDGLPDNVILTILEDRDQGLWLGTPNGLCNVRIMTDPASGRIELHCRNYDESFGLQGREFNENAALRTRKGELIFGGAGGFNIFDPHALREPAIDPALVFTDLQVFNTTKDVGISTTREITLHYNENVFSIGFAALDILHTRRLRYAYRLEGFNKDWLYSDGQTRRAMFTNLDPGHYTLHVRVVGEDGLWAGQQASLGIIIRPPFWRTTLAYIIYIVLLAFAIWGARRIILQRVNARRLHELDMLKIKFFTNVSHEFRTPLSLILTPLDKIIRNTEDSGRKGQLQLIQRNARRLLNMVNQLLDFRRLESQELRLNPSEGDIIQFVRELSGSFTDIAEKKMIDLQFHTGVPVLHTSFDHDKLERIIFNLLSNAFKFTPEYGRISVTMDLRPGAAPGQSPFLTIEVADTGIGIEADRHEKIFERFFQNEGPLVSQGSGIGLAITREFVSLHNGTITVDSAPGKGSRFTMALPLSGKLTTTAPRAIPEPVREAKKPLVLLVEDNEDFRFYLKDNLKEFFTILEAPDGQAGWQKTLGAHPDLVVSDVNMPHRDGIDLCRKIKADRRTSHIPVILLTAMYGEDHQLKGLETGANDYMTKPFNFEILLSKIRNLLSQQARAKETYTRQVEVQPAAAEQESPDQLFLKKALEIVEQHIAEPDFTVEELSRQLFCSRVALYKRLLHHTGKTPIEFIRSIRLKRAAQLLEKEKFTVAEIAYEVGFNNPKIFSRYFKEEFGLLPSAYQKHPKA